MISMVDFLPDINIFAVFVVFGVNIILGVLWYSKFLFGNYWIKEMEFTDEDLVSPSPVFFVFTLLSGLIMSLVLAFFVSYAGADNFFEGLYLGFLAFIGFVATSHINTIVYEGRKISIYLLYMGYQLVYFLFAGILFAVW